MELVTASREDLPQLIALYRTVTEDMEIRGLDQWHWGEYPSEDMIREDVEKGRMYCEREDSSIVAAVVIPEEQDPEYDSVEWRCGIRPGVFYKLAVDPYRQGKGIGSALLDDVIALLRGRGCDCIRCDTSVRNERAIRLYEHMGFQRCGYLYWYQDNRQFVCFDKLLKRETPILPIRMTPAFRSGKLTPWGGDRLREQFGKNIPEVPTGESLEVSCIPGLESRDPMGRTLPELIGELADKLIGRCIDRPFPLLLKLIDAREMLSVQVHPDDAYAERKENGKLGKTEAWLILDTPEGGGELVYGIRPGTTLKELGEASAKGEAVETLLRKVRVKPGDVCYIPAGCVHAIGAGILLYEIQQSSDITYRFYDWNRTDSQGRRRELHLDKALDVTDLRCSPLPVRVEKSFGIKRVLNEEYFTLDILRSDSEERIPPLQNFGLFTVLEGELTLRWEGGCRKLKRGDTCFLPCSTPPLTAAGTGTAALAMPAEHRELRHSVSI